MSETYKQWEGSDKERDYLLARFQLEIVEPARHKKGYSGMDVQTAEELRSLIESYEES